MNVLAQNEIDSVAALSLSGVGKRYANGELSVDALRDVTLEIGAGEFVAIVGASGSGKSTLMNILGGLDTPSSGTYRVDGVDVAELDPDELAHLRRDSFGFIFHSYNLIPTATATENVELPGIYAGLRRDDRRERAEKLLETLGLGDRTEHRPTQLSGGQQQRVSIARALMNGGQVILADEPTGALDSRSGEELMVLLRSMKDAGHTIIIITHDHGVAERADRLIEISDGRIVSDTRKTPLRQSSGRPDPIASRERPGWTALSGFAQALKMGWRALISNPLRTALTLLGIVIGVAAVIVMMAIGNGSSQEILDRITAIGSNQLTITPGVAAGGRFQAGTATLVVDDADAIAEISNVDGVSPQRSGNVTLRYGNLDHQTSAVAAWPTYAEVLNWPLAVGTFLNWDDEEDYAPVAVLGSTVAEALFPDDPDPTGEYLLVGQVPFLVVGVMTERGSTGGTGAQDDSIIVPLSTGMLRLFGQQSLNSITVVVEDIDLIDETAADIAGLLIERHGVEDVTIRNNASLLETVSESQDTFAILLGSVAAISLLVGGIGVMNIMLVNVTERRREIGIRMATGARTRDILRQFNSEAVVVSAIGGLIGALVGLGVTAALGELGVTVAFRAGPVILAFSSAFMTGLVFGYLPARKAATLDPAVALASA